MNKQQILRCARDDKFEAACPFAYTATVTVVSVRVDRPVERVALEGYAPCLGDQADQILAAQSLRRGRAGVMIDLLFDDGSVDVVGAEAQRDLRHLRRHHLPVRLDVREVVEHQARHGDLPQVEHAGGLRQVLQRRVLRMKRQRDERLEAVRVVLQRAQLQQVIDAVFVILDVAVEHGRIRLQSDFVRGARDLQPLAAVDLVIADDVPDAIGENFRAAAGHRVEPRFFQLYQHFARRHLADLREERNLHHGERLQVNLRKALLQAGDQVKVVLERQVRHARPPTMWNSVIASV